MPFDPAPIIKVTPWVADHPQEALALRDLAAYLRKIPASAWDFSAPFFSTVCGSACCAMGHAAMVPSCTRFMDPRRDSLTLDEYSLSLPIEVSDSFFYGRGFERFDEVRAPMVADRIDHWLSTGEIR